MITLSLLTFNHNIKIIHIVKYHTIDIHMICIKCHKGSYYPHLLNNYLFNYLKFSGLTTALASRCDAFSPIFGHRLASISCKG